MRFALHMGTLRGFGSGAVGRNVLRHLVALGSGHEFAAWVPNHRSWRSVRGLSGCRTTEMNAGIAPKVWNENVSIRRELRIGRFDALFSLGDTGLPGCPTPHLLMVQQAYLAYPSHEWGFAVPRVLRVKLALMECYFNACLSSVTHFTVQTESMKVRLCRRWDLDPARVTVVPSVPSVNVRPRRIQEGKPYICYVASPSPHKNFTVLARVMATLQPVWPDLICRLSVEPDEVPGLVAEADRLGVTSQFDFLGRVDDVGALLAGAQALIMPSKLESFGLPYYEAMAMSCPVVAADREFAHEACGPAALYADPDDPEAFAEQVNRILGDRSLAVELAEVGQARIAGANWSWAEAARTYLSLLEELGGRRNTEQ